MCEFSAGPISPAFTGRKGSHPLFYIVRPYPIFHTCCEQMRWGGHPLLNHDLINYFKQTHYTNACITLNKEIHYSYAFFLDLECGLNSHFDHPHHQCVCDPGWTGAHCETAFDQQLSRYLFVWTHILTKHKMCFIMFLTFVIESCCYVECVLTSCMYIWSWNYIFCHLIPLNMLGHWTFQVKYALYTVDVEKSLNVLVLLVQCAFYFRSVNCLSVLRTIQHHLSP